MGSSLLSGGEWEEGVEGALRRWASISREVSNTHLSGFLTDIFTTYQPFLIIISSCCVQCGTQKEGSPKAHQIWDQHRRVGRKKVRACVVRHGIGHTLQNISKPHCRLWTHPLSPRPPGGSYSYRSWVSCLRSPGWCLLAICSAT
jgi:hypothetical protein